MNYSILLFYSVILFRLCFLKPRVATWRYQRGNRSLEANLNLSGVSTLSRTDNAPSFSYLDLLPAAAKSCELPPDIGSGATLAMPCSLAAAEYKQLPTNPSMGAVQMAEEQTVALPKIERAEENDEGEVEDYDVPEVAL